MTSTESTLEHPLNAFAERDVDAILSGTATQRNTFSASRRRVDWAALAQTGRALD